MAIQLRQCRSIEIKCRERIHLFSHLGNELPPQLGLHSWILSSGQGKTQMPSLSSVPHDIYAIGTQEARVSERDWVNKMKKLLQNQFNIDFHLVCTRCLYHCELLHLLSLCDVCQPTRGRRLALAIIVTTNMAALMTGPAVNFPSIPIDRGKIVHSKCSFWTSIKQDG